MECVVLFCPELTSQPFVLNFLFDDDGKVKQTYGLSRCTVAMRAVLAVHQESRYFSLRALPDTLNFGGGFDLVHFRKERDIVTIEPGLYHEWVKTIPVPRMIPGFSESVVNLLVFYNDAMYTKKWLKTYCHFPNLRVLYDRTRIENYSDEKLAWCKSDYVHSAMDHMEMEICYWPDLIYHRHYARRHVQSPQVPAGIDVMTWALWDARKTGELDACQCLFTKQDIDHLNDVKVWPFVCSSS